MLRTLSPEQRRTFGQRWHALPAEQRAAYLQKVLQMAPEQRASELGGATTPR
jgi:hypothetical protein